MKLLEEMSEPGNMVSYEFDVEHSDGTIISVDAVSNIIETDEGKKFFVSSLRDITSLKQLEKDLIIERTQYRDVILSDAVFAYTFDVTKGFRFSTYAMYWIKQAISRAMLNNGRTIRIPIHMLELKSKYLKAVQELTKIFDREPQTGEIAKFMNLEAEKVQEIETLIKDPVSLNTTLNDEEDGTLEDLVADPNQDRPDDRIDNELRAKAINIVLETLGEREKNVIIARFGLNGTRAKTLEEIAAEYKLTKERIRQIEQAALHKLRNPRRLEALKPHIDL